MKVWGAKKVWGKLRKVIPREGVESLDIGIGDDFDADEIVIPREGVESKTIAKAKSVRAEGIVIPREGVESAGAFAGKLNFTRASDPERGS